MAKRTPRAIDRTLRREIVRLAARGHSYREILERVDTSMGAITIALRDWGGVTRADVFRDPTPLRLSADERVEIRVGLELGWSFSRIGAELGRATSTISREVAANGGRAGYRPLAAERRAAQAARRPKTPKLAGDGWLLARVVADLKALWSPEQIARRLRVEFPDDPERWVSHETIYKTIYVQGRGELRRELARCLRTGRAQRRPQGRTAQRGRIIGMVNISERPAEVADRAVPGHWEGDLIVGAGHQSAIATLVERTTRYVLLAQVNDTRAETVSDAIARVIQRLPGHLRRSLTWDQGHEMAGHARFSIDTGIDVYFCDPRSPWQRGTNENTNGLLRQYFPKGTNLAGHTQDELDAVAVQLNGRPRKTLHWKTPAEQLDELLALTA